MEKQSSIKLGNLELHKSTIIDPNLSKSKKVVVTSLQTVFLKKEVVISNIPLSNFQIFFKTKFSKESTNKTWVLPWQFRDHCQKYFYFNYHFKAWDINKAHYENILIKTGLFKIKHNLKKKSLFCNPFNSPNTQDHSSFEMTWRTKLPPRIPWQNNMNKKTTQHSITGTINKPVLIPSLFKTNIPGTPRCFIGNQEQKFSFQSIGGPALELFQKFFEYQFVKAIRTLSTNSNQFKKTKIFSKSSPFLL